MTNAKLEPCLVWDGEGISELFRNVRGGLKRERNKDLSIWKARSLEKAKRVR